MLRDLLAGRSGRRGPEAEPEEKFDDHILPDGLDHRAILEGMKITMQNGTIKTAIERVSEALRPIIVNEMFPDYGVSAEVLEQSTTTLESEVRQLPSTRNLAEADGDWELATALAVAELVPLVEGQYREAADLSAIDGHLVDEDIDKQSCPVSL